MERDKQRGRLEIQTDEAVEITWHVFIQSFCMPYAIINVKIYCESSQTSTTCTQSFVAISYLHVIIHVKSPQTFQATFPIAMCLLSISYLDKDMQKLLQETITIQVTNERTTDPSRQVMSLCIDGQQFRSHCILVKRFYHTFVVGREREGKERENMPANMTFSPSKGK